MLKYECSVLSNVEILVYTSLTDFFYLQEGADKSAWNKPFRSTIPPLSASVTERLKAPSDDESSGLVMVCWFGPSAEVYLNQSVYFDELMKCF